MISKEYADGLTEVLTILDNTEIEFVNKIPINVMEFFRKNASNDYKPSFNPKIEIKDMNIKKETKNILSAIYIKYWAENEKEKQNFIHILKQNQKQIDDEIRKNYNPENLFNKYNLEANKNIVDNNIQLIEYKKKGIVKKLLEKIKKFFR